MASRALPRPDRVPEQRLLSPEIHRRWRRSCRTLSGNLPIDLGFSIGRLFYRRRGVVRRRPGGSHHRGGATRGWATPPHGEAGPWPPSGSLLVLVLRPGKIGVWVFVSSNSENISYVAFLKHKNSRKQGTGTMPSCQ
jgi:hypothetical protein